MRILLLFLLMIVSCHSKKQNRLFVENKPNNENIVAINGSLSVKGNQIVNAKNEVVSFAGNSFFWSNDYYRGNSFYNKNVVKWLKKDWNTSIIRIPMAADPEVQDSYLFAPEKNEEKVIELVDAAIDLGLYVIIGWHSHRAEQNEKEAIVFFEKMAKKYGHLPNIIYEIYNEPLKVSWDTVVKPYAEKVIAAIRKIDSENIIVVGTPHWSQDVDIASENPISGYKNIAYTLHFYAGSHKKWLMAKAQKALDNNIALIVTEWGSVDADGAGVVDHESTKIWMDFMNKNNLTHCNWSINDKEEASSILKVGANKNGNWENDDLTESGNLSKLFIKDWSK